MAVRYSTIADVNGTGLHDLVTGCDCVNATGNDADLASAHVLEDLLIKNKIKRDNYNRHFNMIYFITYVPQTERVRKRRR